MCEDSGYVGTLFSCSILLWIRKSYLTGKKPKQNSSQDSYWMKNHTNVQLWFSQAAYCWRYSVD